MTREERTTAMDKAIEAAARALSPHLRFYGDGHGHAVTIAGKTIKAFLAALEAAGVRLVPVDEKPGQGWLHEAVKDACLRASKNSGGTPPQLIYAPILWAMQDALAASPYAALKETDQ